jgi:hypothetical protein
VSRTAAAFSSASGLGSAVAGTRIASAPSGRANIHPRRAGVQRDVASRHARDTRRLRALVRRRRGCLAELPTGARRLLRLRAGLGEEAGLSAESVARILHVSPAREVRLERRALTALRLEARHGCPAVTVSSSFTVFTGAQPAAMASSITDTAGSASGVASPPANAGGSISQAGGTTRAAGKTKSRSGKGSGPHEDQASIAGAPVGSSSSLLPILLGVLAIGAAGLVLVLVLLPLERNRLRRARAAAYYADNHGAVARERRPETQDSTSTSGSAPATDNRPSQTVARSGAASGQLRPPRRR